VDVCILGRIGYDLFAVEHARPLAEVAHFSRHLGGSSANIAVGLARLGLKVGLISAIGQDELAPYLMDFLASEGVDTRFVRQVRGYRTSLCLTEVSPPSSFSQVFYRANPADSQVRVGEEELKAVRGARMFVTNGTSLAADPSHRSTLAVLEAARKAGCRTVFDVDYRGSSWKKPEDAGQAAHAVLRWVDVLLGNEEELAVLTGGLAPEEAVAAIRKEGVSLQVHKRGAEGAKAYEGEQSWTLPPLPTAVVCAIGAGDAFASGLLYGLCRGLPAGECLQYGNTAASLVVGRVSCSDSMPYREELETAVQSAYSGQRR